MFGFGAKLPVDDDEWDWLVACTAWAVGVMQGEAGLRSRRLVTPDAFVLTTARGHALAQDMFDQVKALCGMADWPCELRAGLPERESRVGTGLALRHGGARPLGTFQARGNAAVITYNPSQLTQPATLVATFAHELAHYLIAAHGTPPPGGSMLEEHATDLVAVMLGFGIFQANGAKTFRGFQNFEEQGWEVRTAGYLSEMALVTALALFLQLTEGDTAAAARELKPYLRAPLRRAVKACDRRASQPWDMVRAVDLADWR